MLTDQDIWNEIGTLTLNRDEGSVDLPPLQSEGGDTGPLRIILRHFLNAPPETRSRYTLRLANGQAFNDQDISELLSRPDCPVC